jgi:hypothetical protein
MSGVKKKTSQEPTGEGLAVPEAKIGKRNSKI